MDALCEQCAYCAYDEESEQYVCDAAPDEDEMARFLSEPQKCSWFRPYDEYKLVQKQN